MRSMPNYIISAEKKRIVTEYPKVEIDQTVRIPKTDRIPKPNLAPRWTFFGFTGCVMRFVRTSASMPRVWALVDPLVAT